mmetsp:Transcript_16469/g.33849  ORF Transcript_16469/g.33849 Transcript_16469/m.33849 type:complete len:169 (-) Transcript_16469:2585-3091(-)
MGDERPTMAPRQGRDSGRLEPRRDMRTSTKINSDFKWKTDRSVVGALEVVADPSLDLRAPMELREIFGYEAELESYYKTWRRMRLTEEFIKAFEDIPPQTTCCGVMTEQDKTVKQNVALLNKGWVKATNERLERHDFKISLFVWSWTNVLGKSETVIPMIRFHNLTEN